MTEKEILEATYNDRCDVYRRANSENEYGITKQVRQLIYQGISCALSQSKSSNPLENEAHTSIRSEHILFLSPDFEILAGDELEITIGASGKTRRFWAGESFVYTSHQELPLLREERI
jgi:hypothetical protein